MRVLVVLFLLTKACSIPNGNFRTYPHVELDSTKATAHHYGRHGVWWRYMVDGKEYFIEGSKDRKGIYLGETNCVIVYETGNPNNSVLHEEKQLPQSDAIAEIRLRGVIRKSYRKGDYIIAVCKIEEQSDKKKAKEWEQAFTISQDSIINFHEMSKTPLLLTVYVTDTNATVFSIHEAILSLEPFPDSIKGPTVYWYKDSLY